MLRHLRKICEPALSDLLSPARFIQIHKDVCILRFEIGWRIVKRKVPVFTDADECNIDLSSL